MASTLKTPRGTDERTVLGEHTKNDHCRLNYQLRKLRVSMDPTHFLEQYPPLVESRLRHLGKYLILIAIHEY